MASNPPDAAPLIAGQFAVDLTKPMPGWGAGLACFVAIDVKSERSGHLALLVGRDAPLRAQAVNSLAAMPIDGILTPIAHGPGIGPGVGTGVRGGPTYREMQLCMEMIADTGRLASLDVVEINPALDVPSPSPKHCCA